MYAELHCKTNYSFLTGGSHADELIERAAALDYSAVAITDENSLAGVVRAYAAVRESVAAGKKIKLIIGAEIIPHDAPPVLLWATDRRSYAQLSQLITVGRRRAPKGECWLSIADIAQHSDGLLAGVIPQFAGDRSRVDHMDETHPSYEWFFGNTYSPPRPQNSDADRRQWKQSHSEFLGRGGRGVRGNQTGVPEGEIEDDRLEAYPTYHAEKRSDRLEAYPTYHAEKRSDRLEAYPTYREIFGDRGYLMASLYRGIDDHWRIDQLLQLSQQTGLPLVAAGDVLYHQPQRLPLHDVLTAIKHRTTVASAEHLLLPNAQRHLQTIAQRQIAFRRIPAALQRTIEIADRCDFCLSQLRYEYPEELAPAGQTPIEYLRELTQRGMQQRYPDGVPVAVQQQIQHELALIDELRYEAYFLTVWDLVRFARSRGILCQGRGSAANSAVCYCLGVTSVDPATSDLLFERFISKERDEAPDIDVDFEHERREEVLQYLYDKYGRDRAGLAATVITYRVRSAVRDVGKALGLSLDRVDALAKNVEGYSKERDLPRRMNEVGIDPESTLGKQLQYLIDDLLGFPRHLSQHVGGMVITQGKLDELVPIENAAMDGRTVIQWDKNDLEELGLLKVDCLCLGMLSAIRKCFDLIQQNDGPALTLANIPAEDPKVYDMICAADTVGVFQIESRGQMSMLPRLKPRCWYDLVIEVAIVRPGPIQGNMVHPYLRRRNGDEPIQYPNEEIKSVLHRTLGVPIFQEQAMKLAVVAAGFTPGEADQLRRAMGKWRKTGIIQQFHDKLIDGMRQRGLTGEFAEQVFRQISGFGEYGFPESHAASFAKLVYVSAWLKFHYPAAFCAAIINSQPMGFYAPAQLVADAKQHGVEVLPVDVNHSNWDCQVQTRRASECAPSCLPTHSLARRVCILPISHSRLRLGFRLITGFRCDMAETIIQARRSGSFASISDFTQRTRLSQAIVAQLSAADAFGSLDQDRRAALWQALAQEKKPQHQPLFADLETADDDTFALPKMDLPAQVTADYRAVGLSLKAHPLSFHRAELEELRATTCAGLIDKVNNRQVRVAGLVILRQRPSTAKGITFVTLEDETGTANLVVKPDIWERHYKIARGSAAWLAHGKLEMKSGVIHVVVNRLEDLGDRINDLKIKSRDFR